MDMIPHDEPMPEILDNPETPETSAEEKFHCLKIAGVPARYVKCPGKWIGVAVNELHDYQLSVHRLKPGSVVVEFSIDGESQCLMACKSFEVARRCAIAAARAYAKYKAHLAKAHKARRERIRAAKAAEPLSPDEELAATIARQKEGC